jgi:ketosteroid isomerase-like protein
MQLINRSKESVRKTLDEFTTGWENLDAVRVLATIAKNHETIIYGTDLVERWFGYEAFVEPVKAQMVAFKNPKYTWGEGEPRIQVKGDVAWASGELTVRLGDEGEVQENTMRSTFVLIWEDDYWKIIQAHFSIGMETPVVAY